MVQVSEPYSRIDSTVAWNRLIFRSLLMSDCQIVLILWQAAQALAFLTKKSCSELAIHDPRYTKSSTSSITHPLLETSGAGMGLGVLTKRYLVLPSFMWRPTHLAASSRLSRNSCASLMVSVIRATKISACLNWREFIFSASFEVWSPSRIRLGSNTVKFNINTRSLSKVFLASGFATAGYADHMQ